MSVDRVVWTSILRMCEVEKDVIARDHSDQTRAVAPLKKADDAIVIDTTNMTVAEVAERIVKEVETC